MAKLCLAHPDRPAVAMCHHCHKPVCTSCTVVQPYGQFCSTECGVLYRDFRERAAAMKAPKAGFAQKIVVVLVVIILVAFVAGVVSQAGILRWVKIQSERLRR